MKVIWVLLSLDELLSIFLVILISRINNGIYEEVVFWPYYVIFQTISLGLNSITHWIFAIQYFEVVLKLPLILDRS